MLREAEAKGIKLLNDAKASKETLAIKSFESLEKVADGKATKIIVPSSMQDLSSYAASFKEFLKEEKIVEEQNKIEIKDNSKKIERKVRDNENVPHVFEEHPY